MLPDFTVIQNNAKPYVHIPAFCPSFPLSLFPSFPSRFVFPQNYAPTETTSPLEQGLDLMF